MLDVLTPEQVLECHTEEESVALVKLLPPTQAALLDWAVNLMADVVQDEVVNKMNARNIAMVFAPNMTQVSHLRPPPWMLALEYHLRFFFHSSPHFGTLTEA